MPKTSLTLILTLSVASACHTTSQSTQAVEAQRQATELRSAPPPIPLAEMPPRPRPLYESVGQRYMVVTQGEATTRAARRMFELGGNAIDAAAAASFAIAVERPQSTGIAGGGFLVGHFAKNREVLAVDFREVAPKAARQNLFQDARGQVIPNLSTDGGLASAVPGMVAGVLEVHARYGRLGREVILQPAIELAEKGVVVYPHLAAAIADRKGVLAKSPAALAIFFKNKDPDRPLALGDRLVQKDLAKVLREIGRRGRDGFYKGWVARALIAEQRRTGGVITLDDLARYEVKYRKPVSVPYGPYLVHSMPPPSSGGVHVTEMLNILEGFPGDGWTAPYEAKAVHRTASAMQMAYFDRARYLGDPDFVKVPVAGLVSQVYADAWRARIPENQALTLGSEAPQDPFRYESRETTHFTIADHEGNVVASTQTINGWFGSGVVVDRAGFVMNNEMDDFSAKPGVPNKFGLIGGVENAIQPRKRPLSSMTPTIVTQAGRPVLALGSPSGSQIINCVLLTTLNYLTYRLPLWEAVSAVRYHHQWRPDQLLVERPGLAPPVAEMLSKMGHKVVVGEIGCKVQAIAYEPSGIRGVSDPRGEGLAACEGPIPLVAVPEGVPGKAASYD